jgi:hypothetical protein
MIAAFAQAAMYVATGLWPLLSMRTFEAVTGEKAEDWLVKTVGTLIVVIGTTLAVAAFRDRVTSEIALLGVGSALALIAIDVVYVARRVIPPIYLADAAVEAVLVSLWLSRWPGLE